MDFINKKYNIMDVVDAISEFEKRTGDSFFDFTLTQVDGKNIKVCREKEIKGGIVINDDYDLFIVQNEICINIKRDFVLNMFANFEDFVNGYNKDEI